MVYEHVHIVVRTGREADFEANFAAGRSSLESAPGCGSVELHRSVDKPGTYLLRVGWSSLSDNVELFQNSVEHADLTRLLRSDIAEATATLHFSAEEL